MLSASLNKNVLPSFLVRDIFAFVVLFVYLLLLCLFLFGLFFYANRRRVSGKGKMPMFYGITFFRYLDLTRVRS